MKKIFFLCFVSIIAAAPLILIESERPCDVPSQKSLPFCDASLSFRERAKNLVSLLSTEEKINQLANKADAIASKDIPAYQWWSEALHGVGYSPGVSFDSGSIRCATSFPQVINSASTFNASLWKAIGTTVSTEARAMNNNKQAGLTYWAPNINIARDPRWGRLHETSGEDTLLTSTYAINFVRGMQEGEDPSHLKVSSCCKHYFAYSLENWDHVDRHHFDAIVSKRDEADTYMPAFEACVREGHASSLMCSYNSVNGVPSCANEEIMNGLARKSWNFEGYITSDCGATDDVIYTHHYTNTTAATCSATLSAGMDIDCGTFLKTNLKQAVDSGVVTQEILDTPLVNLFTVRMRLGHFDSVESQPYMKYGPDRVATAEHTQLALDAARQSLVLLKNDGTLPLSKKTGKIAVVGPHFNATNVMLGNYEGRPCSLPSVLQSLELYTNVESASGCDNVACKDTKGFSNAVKIANESDVTLVFVGLDGGQESEGRDRNNLVLPGKQADLISQVCAVAKKCVVVIITGGPVDVSDAKNSDRVNAILAAGYPGEKGSQAIAEVIFGDVNPSGRLPMTWYPQSFVSKASLFNMNMRSNSTYPGRTYRFYTDVPVFPFGFGLSYTKFEYSMRTTTDVLDRKLVEKAASSKHYFRGHEHDSPLAQIDITVKNTGEIAGGDSVLLFAHPPAGIPGAPIKQLIAFDRVFLEAGESQTVTVTLFAHDFTLVNEEGARVTGHGAWVLEVGDQKLMVYMQ